MQPRPARPIDARLLATLRRRGVRTVFVLNDFLELGTRSAIASWVTSRHRQTLGFKTPAVMVRQGVAMTG